MSELKYLDQFKSLFTNYSPNQLGLKILSQTPLVLLISLTAGGRNTIISRLTKTGRYQFLISDTTRKPRVNNGQLEKHGQNYWFYDEETMLGRLQSKELLEFAVIHNQQVSGLSYQVLKEAGDSHKVGITDLDIQGYERLSKYPNQIKAIFLLPPSVEVWQQRLRSRGPLSPDELERRIQSAAQELSSALQAPGLEWLINHDLNETTQAIDDFIQEKGSCLPREVAHKQAHDFLKSLEA